MSKLYGRKDVCCTSPHLHWNLCDWTLFWCGNTSNSLSLNMRASSTKHFKSRHEDQKKCWSLKEVRNYNLQEGLCQPKMRLDQKSVLANFGRVFNSQRENGQNLGLRWWTSTKLCQVFGQSIFLVGRREDEVVNDFGRSTGNQSSHRLIRVGFRRIFQTYK